MARHASLPFDTVHVGGGTPSILAGREIISIIETLHRLFNIQPNSEITLEVNPGTVDPEKLRQYKTAGINRLNIGVQSFHTAFLKFLGRIHTGKEAASVIHQARDIGFDNIGIDLIYGLPGQTRHSWITDLQTAVDFNPEHLSCYMLTCEKNTPLWKRMKDKAFLPLPDRNVTQQFNDAMVFLENNSYRQYEISNFAKSSPDASQNFTSRHNSKYWSFSPYCGFGPSAHSFREPRRRWNVRSIKKYIALISQGRRPLAGEETLSREQMMIEAVYLGLRQTHGIEIETYNRKFGVDFAVQFKETITDLLREEHICIDKERCGLSRKGMVFLDSIAQMFVDKIR